MINTTITRPNSINSAAASRRVLCSFPRAQIFPRHRKSLHAAAGLDHHIGQRLLCGRVVGVHVEQRQRRELSGRTARHQLEAVTFRAVPLVHYFLQLKECVRELYNGAQSIFLFWKLTLNTEV